MRYILTAEQMKAADARMIEEIGIPSAVLMERAALQCVNAMKEEKVDLEKALVVCGSGNNGGDGFAIARLLWEEGLEAEVVFVGKMESRTEETRRQMSILENLGIFVGNSLPEKEYSVIIDAVFGIGLSRNIEGKYREVIERMNRYRGYKVAVDTPSGVSSDTGAVLGCAFRADLTVTFAYQKLGQVLYPGCEYTGKTVVRQIGIKSPMLEEKTDVHYTFEWSDAAKKMPKRVSDSNKGTYGRVLLVVGSKGMSGAAYLSAKAAYLSGAGLVRIYTEESNRSILQQLLPEAIVSAYDAEKEGCFSELNGLLEWADVVCIGCGLGMSEVSLELLKFVLKYNNRPCVVDADGLNLIAGLSNKDIEQWDREKNEYVLTPHMKEMSRLTGYTVQELKENRTALIKGFTGIRKVVCAMKDSRTYVAGNEKPVFVNTSGNSAMAKAGAGDVLAGLITGLMAQKMSGYEAAVLGVYLHGLAGDEARKKCGTYSVLAEDILSGIKSVLKNLEEQQQ